MHICIFITNQECHYPQKYTGVRPAPAGTSAALVFLSAFRKFGQHFCPLHRQEQRLRHLLYSTLRNPRSTHAAALEQPLFGYAG